MFEKNKFFFWSPMLSNVGTINAIIGMANSLSRYTNNKIYVLDILGEFKNFHNSYNLNFLSFIINTTCVKIFLFTLFLEKLYLH